MQAGHSLGNHSKLALLIWIVQNTPIYCWVMTEAKSASSLSMMPKTICDNLMFDVHLYTSPDVTCFLPSLSWTWPQVSGTWALCFGVSAQKVLRKPKCEGFSKICLHTLTLTHTHTHTRILVYHLIPTLLTLLLSPPPRFAISSCSYVPQRKSTCSSVHPLRAQVANQLFWWIIYENRGRLEDSDSWILLKLCVLGPPFPPATSIFLDNHFHSPISTLALFISLQN